MRVLHVIDTSFVGGGQTALRHLLAGFKGSDVTTELACRAGGPLMEEAEALGARVHAVPFDKRYLPNKAQAVARIVRDSRIDLIHSHGLLATYYCTLARTMFGARVPLVYHQHGFHHHNHGRLTRSLRIRAEHWICKHADRVIAVSRSDQLQLLREQYASTDRVRLIHYGLPDRLAAAQAVNAAREAIGADADADADAGAAAGRGLSARRPVVGLVARLHPQKGVDTFLRAAAEVSKQEPSTLFTIVGVGELEGELRALATSLGFNGNLRWIDGRVPGIAAMPVFTVGVLSSRWEGLPLVLLEYMANSRPIVATQVEGCLDAVGPNEAELVPPDDVPAMSGAILRLMRDRELAARRAAAARARFDEAFTLQVMISRVRALYDEVCR
jgi:glycosyltransferase involved in cell wall biosynthesis